jgi:hypothetical protein
MAATMQVVSSVESQVEYVSTEMLFLFVSGAGSGCTVSVCGEFPFSPNRGTQLVPSRLT